MHSLLFQPTIQSLEIISVPSCSCRDDITSTLCDPDRTNERTPLLASDHPENRPPAQHRLRIREVAIRSREALLAFASSLQRVPPITWQFACAIGCVCIILSRLASLHHNFLSAEPHCVKEYAVSASVASGPFIVGSDWFYSFGLWL